MNRCTIRAAGNDLRVGFKYDGQGWDLVKDALKEIPGAHWLASTKEWAIPAAYHRRVLAWAKEWFDTAEITDYSRVDEPRRESRREAPQQRPASPLDQAYRALFLQPGAPPWAVTAVYRAAARELHPDVGGSHERMVAVNRAVEALRRAGVAS